MVHHFSIEMVLLLALPMTIAPDAELLHLPTSIHLGRCSIRVRIDRYWPGQTDDCQSAWLLVRMGKTPATKIPCDFGDGFDGIELGLPH